MTRRSSGDRKGEQPRFGKLGRIRQWIESVYSVGLRAQDARGVRGRREAWSLALADQGVRDPILAEELGELYGTERRQRHECFADVPACLDELRDSYVLGLITNGAVAAGLRCIWINRYGRERPDSADVLEIATLSELPAVLECVEATPS